MNFGVLLTVLEYSEYFFVKLTAMTRLFNSAFIRDGRTRLCGPRKSKERSKHRTFCWTTPLVTHHLLVTLPSIGGE